jgi:hypothetical protein
MRHLPLYLCKIAPIIWSLAAQVCASRFAQNAAISQEEEGFLINRAIKMQRGP